MSFRKQHGQVHGVGVSPLLQSGSTDCFPHTTQLATTYLFPLTRTYATSTANLASLSPRTMAATHKPRKQFDCVQRACLHMSGESELIKSDLACLR